jgi:hypothetical protein
MHTGRNKYGIFFKAILWAILIIPEGTHMVMGGKRKG